MINSITFIYLISALIATAYGGSCLSGYGRNSDICKEKSVVSRDYSRCIVISEYQQVYGKKYKSVYKGHSGNLPCNTVLYGYTEEAQLFMNFRCCYGEDCNISNYEIPSDDHEPRGKSCPACFGNTLKECVSKKEIVCKNPEDKCMTYISNVRNPDGSKSNYSIKGCASPLACKIGFGGMIGAHQKFHPRLKCY
ncbi:uncharacterized protein O3C94_014563 [Discoglossus pictus]